MSPTDNVLIQINTAANMAGIQAVQSGLLGLSGQLLALTAAFAILYKIGSDGVDNYRKQEDAVGMLSQAYATQKDTLKAHEQAIHDFMATNAKYIEDQYDTLQALANLIRAGYDTTDALRVLADALDYAALKHIPVTEAEKALVLIMAGNKKAIKELGISQEDYDKIINSKTLTTAEKQRAILKLIEERTKGVKETTDDVKQSQNELTKAWQDFTAKTGPGVVLMWRKLNEAAATGLGILTLWLDLYEKIAMLIRGGAGAALKLGGTAPLPGLRGKAAGGPVTAGTAYTVGEQGPETLVMGSQGGSIIPNGAGGGGNHIHLHIGTLIGADGPGMDRLAREILQRARFAPGQ